jgi:hypothetical protein
MAGCGNFRPLARHALSAAQSIRDNPLQCREIGELTPISIVETHSGNV